jgi:hypothetical protein
MRVRLAWAVFAIGRLASAADAPDCGPATTNPAASCPDRHAWQLFAAVNAPLPGGAAQWEEWSTDQTTFPKTPDPKQCATRPDACPQWLPGVADLDTCLDPKQQRPRKSLAAVAKAPAGEAPECVHRNRVAFDYVVQNALWYREGLAAAYTKGTPVQFPQASIAVKTNWQLLASGADASRFHVHRTPDGAVYALVSFHITTRDLPNWFWATFEHVDNPGRCDFLGCHDSFGQTPADTPPRTALGQTYPAESLTPAVQQVLKALPPEWRNYRLKGSQVDFVDATGRATVVGNSVTEDGFVQGASCITCHSRAAVGSDGTAPQSPQPGAPNFGQKPDGQSYNGAPVPEWFYDGLDPRRRVLLPTDFVWGPAFQAQAIGGTKR